MQIWLGVENFAKIESAKVCINRYTLLVGQNNSGKTFLMQLIQGVMEKLTFLVDADLMEILFVESAEEYDSYIFSRRNVMQFVQYLNDKLQREKDNIVKEIFGKDIPIERLYLDISMTEDVLYIIYILDSFIAFTKYSEKIFDARFRSETSVLFSKPHHGKICVLDMVETNKDTFHTFFVGGVGSDDFAMRGVARDFMNQFINPESFFLPSSRTGLSLLYREFFVNKADDAILYEIGKNRTIKSKKLYGGITKPIYEFLRFLQAYSESKDQKEVFQEELQFFENNVIEGHINIDNQKLFFYHSNDDGNETPMYLASSMINETAPIAMAIASNGDYRRLIIDEIEASLHPGKQLEMVRFLNRIYRKGMSLIVSTHSDTFVSKMNNLYILSNYKKLLGADNRRMKNILDKLGLNLEDLIDAEELYVYEFVIQPNGKSVVMELEGKERTGFQFDLFTDSAMKIYHENLEIGELHL